MRQVTHVLLTRPPLIRFPKETSSLDLHVLSTPPAFILSQDQTLNLKVYSILILLIKELLVYVNIFCLIFKDHFFVALKRLLYFIITFELCQHFFQKTF